MDRYLFRDQETVTPQNRDIQTMFLFRLWKVWVNALKTLEES